MDEEPFSPIADVMAQAERILRGEDMARVAAAEPAKIPAWYGARSPAEISDLWLGWARTATLPHDANFYSATAIGWASR